MNKTIYIFTYGISRKNGGSSSIVDLANNLIELGYKVKVFTTFGFLDRFIYKTTNVNSKLNISVLQNNLLKVKISSNKKIILNKFLHFMQFFDYNNIRDSIVIDAIGLSYDFINVLKARGCKVIYNHAGSSNAVIKYFGMNGAKRVDLDKARIEYLEMINFYDYILFQSPTQANDLCNLAQWEVNRAVVLRPGVSTNDIESARSSKPVLNSKYFNIVVIGSVQMRKGQHLIPEIFNRVSKYCDNIKFHIVGNILDEKYKKEVEKTINDSNQDNNIFFLGFKSNYLEYMNSANVVLQLSEEEGVSRVLREAMALKKMIISFKLEGTNDLLVDGEDSLLSEYGDLEKVSSDILKVNANREILNKYALKAYENFEIKYSKAQYLVQLKKLISNVYKND